MAHSANHGCVIVLAVVATFAIIIVTAFLLFANAVLQNDTQTEPISKEDTITFFQNNLSYFEDITEYLIQQTAIEEKVHPDGINRLSILEKDEEWVVLTAISYNEPIKTEAVADTPISKQLCELVLGGDYEYIAEGNWDKDIFFVRYDENKHQACGVVYVLDGGEPRDYVDRAIHYYEQIDGNWYYYEAKEYA